MDSKIDLTLPHKHSLGPARGPTTDQIILETYLELAALAVVFSRIHRGFFLITDFRRLQIAASMIKAASREMDHAGGFRS